MSDYPSLLNLINKKIVSVSELSERIKGAVEGEFADDFIWVAGEISNFKEQYASGHWYFSLKDKDSQISGVCFKNDNKHIKFTPQNGMKVICCGLVNVYQKQGRYQIICSYIEPKGVGAEAMALEQLKDKLLAEGLFDEGRKKPLPFLPETIGVVTSPSGAAIRDILKVLARRFPGIGVIVSPARVQGDEAPGELVAALRKLYSIEEVDVIIVARGGGSKEDLGAFNEEAVARMITKSPVPVISAVGHEIDVTVCDLVADVRAATPSMAAELAVKEKAELADDLEHMESRIISHMRYLTDSEKRHVYQTEGELGRAMENKTREARLNLEGQAKRLDALSPLKVLQRGYSVTLKIPSGDIVTDAQTLGQGDEVLVTFHSGKARCTVERTED